MSAIERAVNNLNIAKLILCNPQMLTPEMCIKIGQAITNAVAMLKEQAKEIREQDRRWKELRSCITEMSENGGPENFACMSLLHRMNKSEKRKRGRRESDG